MRLPRIVIFLALLSLLLFVPAYAQRGGGHSGGGGGRSGGFSAGHFGAGGSRMGGFAGSGGFRAGFSGGNFRGGGFRGGFGDGRFRSGFRYGAFGGFGGYWGYPYWGWGYPYYDFSGYRYGYGYSPYDYDPYAYDSGYASQPYYSAPPPREPVYSQPASPPDFYLIAFTDNTIQAAVSFSVDGDRIRWTTREHADKEAPLSAVDRRFSEEINRDRHVEFRLP